MFKKLLSPAILAVALLGSSCVVTNVKIPLDTDLNQTKLGTKTGEASAQSVLWLVAWGDSGTEAAAKQGGITTLMHADQKILSILFGLYTCQTTVVYGD